MTHELLGCLGRREFLGSVAAIATATTLWSVAPLFGKESERRYKIGICDWDLRGTPSGSAAVFEETKRLGFEGVQLSYRVEGDNKIDSATQREKIKDASSKTGIAIASLAMGFLNQRPLATDPACEQFVADVIPAMVDLKVRDVLLAFFGSGDLRKQLDKQQSVIEKLRRLAPVAEKAGCFLCIESYLNAADHLAILDAVGSDAVRVYYDIRNMQVAEHDIYADIETLLAKKVIREMHLKESDARLGSGQIDWDRVRKLCDRYDYSGWLVVESSVKGDWAESQRENAAYAKKMWATE